MSKIKVPVMAKRRRVCCVIKPTGWSNKNKLKKVFDSIQNLNKFGEQMKISRQILADMWNSGLTDSTPATASKNDLDFTPVLNFKCDWKKASTRPSLRRQRALNRNAYFYKPKRKLAFGKNLSGLTT